MARNFNGSTQRLEKSNLPAALTGIGPMTIACLVRTSSLAATQTALGIGSTATSGPYIALGLLTSGKAFAEYQNNTGTTFDALGTTNVAAVGNWFHLACTLDGAGGMSIISNGANEASVSSMVSTGTPNRLTVGGVYLRAAAMASNFKGDIAEVAAWNVVLTPVELAMLAAGVSPLLVRPSALVTYTQCVGLASEPDLKDATPFTVTAATVAAHPRVIAPRDALIAPAAATGAAAIVVTAVPASMTLPEPPPGLAFTADPPPASTTLSVGTGLSAAETATAAPATATLSGPAPSIANAVDPPPANLQASVAPPKLAETATATPPTLGLDAPTPTVQMGSVIISPPPAAMTLSGPAPSTAESITAPPGHLTMSAASPSGSSTLTAVAATMLLTAPPTTVTLSPAAGAATVTLSAPPPSRSETARPQAATATLSARAPATSSFTLPNVATLSYFPSTRTHLRVFSAVGAELAARPAVRAFVRAR